MEREKRDRCGTGAVLMAVVKLGNKVKTNLPDTIRYVINPEKNDGGRLVYASYSSERQ